MKRYEEYRRKYLKFIGVEQDYKYKMIECEICSNKEFTMIREEVSWGNEHYGKLPVQACNRCGYLMQNPRFERDFYKDFYRIYYRRFIKGSNQPSQEFVEDQIIRGRKLFEYLKSYLPKIGVMLDVGCSSGGFLLPFKEAGWEVKGNDPDEGYVKYGIEKLKLPIDYTDAEDMQLEDNKYDLIIIMGSLEHVYDPNIVLQKCRKASKKDAILVLEGRFIPLGLSKKFFNHNHHRYLRKNSIELIMIKHGWKPLITTTELICGPTRVGNGYCIGRVCDIPSKENFLKLIDSGKKVKPKEIIEELDEIDKNFIKPIAESVIL